MARNMYTIHSVTHKLHQRYILKLTKLETVKLSELFCYASDHWTQQEADGMHMGPEEMRWDEYGTTGAEIKSPFCSVEHPELPGFSFLSMEQTRTKYGESRALSAVRQSAQLTSAFPVHSSSFSPILFRRRKRKCMRCSVWSVKACYRIAPGEWSLWISLLSLFLELDLQLLWLAGLPLSCLCLDWVCGLLEIRRVLNVYWLIVT